MVQEQSKNRRKTDVKAAQKQHKKGAKMNYQKDLTIPLRFRANRRQYESLKALASIEEISTAQVVRNLIDKETKRVALS